MRGYDAPTVIGVSPRRSDVARWPVERVQRWVQAALFFVTAMIFATGLAFLAGHSEVPGAKPALLVMSAVVGVVAVVAVRVINRMSVLTPWLVLGLAPAGLVWWLVLS